MKCILVIKTTYGDYRVFWDIKHSDWFILTPAFKCHRNIHNARLDEYKDKIEKRIDEARNGLITFKE